MAVTEGPAAEQPFRAMFEANPHPMWVYDLESLRFLAVNDAAVARYGYQRDEFLRLTIADIRPPEDVPRLMENVEAVSEGYADGGLWRHCTKDGRQLLVEISSHTLDFEGHQAELVLAMDVTERLRAIDSLRASEAQLRAILDAEPACVKTLARDGSLLDMNPAGLEMLEAGSLGQLVGRRVDELIVPEHRRAFQDLTRRVFEGTPGQLEFEVVGLAGTRRWLETRASPLRDLATSEISALLGVTQDITGRKRVEGELAQSAERLRLAVQASKVGLWDWDLDTGRVVFSPEWKRQIGYAEDELSDDFSEWRERLHPDDRDATLAALGACVEQGAAGFDAEYRFRHRDGSYRHILAAGSLIAAGPGHPARLVGSHVDLTERVALEAQLRQAQRIESIGRLAGGIAHDFNNLLTVINNYAELATAAAEAGEPVGEMLAEIGDAGRRATSLTRQLLAFSRRQPLEPIDLDLGQRVEAVATMLRRLLGADIELVVVVGREPCWVRADPGQIEQVLMNLAVNSRDAMPDGGVLTISAAVADLVEPPISGLAPGPWVCLAVRDTGLGIDDGTRDRIFEPFFTTKEQGKGTGLGLATVHGIVQQSGGGVRVESEPGAGACFEIYLPRIVVPAEASGSSPTADAATDGPDHAARPGRILVVEDERAVRELARRLLEGAGFEVLVACDAHEALRRLAGGPAIDLMLTDVVMPGMSGLELARRVRTERPGLPILLTSGHAEDLLESDGGLPFPFVAKPFAGKALIQRIGELTRSEAHPDLGR